MTSQWIQHFLSLKENEFFCNISSDYIREKHNKTGFAEQLTYFQYALKTLFDIESQEMQKLSWRDKETVQDDAKTLYGLLHSRFITSTDGQYQMMDKFKRGVFGVCPRTYCKRSHVLPIGLTSDKGVDSVKVYCPKCTQIYDPNKIYKNIDGAYFGTTFPHLIFMVLPEFKPEQCPKVYKPQVFGFNIDHNWHKNSMEMKEEQIRDFKKFQEIQKIEATMMQQDLRGNRMLNVKQELDNNSNKIWNQLKAEIKRKIPNNTQNKPQQRYGTLSRTEVVSKQDDEKQLKTCVFKAFVGLDLGTNTTKIAYCLPNDDDIRVLMRTRTAILLEGNGTLRAFGDEAVSIYTATNDNTLLYFENYMMKMYDKKVDKHVTALNGKKYPLADVVICTLKYIKQETLHLLQEKNVKVVDTKDISWVICTRSRYPQMEQRVQQYVNDAELAHSAMPGHVIFKSSMDCAAMSIANDIKAFVWSKRIHHIEYVVMDAGGSNVEYSCDALHDGKVKNILTVSGGVWGDTKMDDIFIHLLCGIFGKQWMNTFKTEKPHSYLTLLCNFRNAKLSYYFHHEWHGVELPLEFIEYIKDKSNGKDIEKMVERFEVNDWMNGFVLKDNVLNIHHNIWIKELFDKSVNKMMDHFNTLVSNEKMRLCQYIYVIGGFGDNHYVQKRLHEEYNDFTKYKPDIVIPKDTMLTIVNGAVMIAKDYGYKYKVIETLTKIEKVSDDQSCYHCDKTFDQRRLRCGGCKRVYYCSSNCQKLNWKIHQTDCKKWRK